MTDENEAKAIREAMVKIDVASWAEYSRFVTPELIAQFADVSGDHHRLHLDAEYVKSTPYGKRIAHGAMLVGFMSTASTILSDDIEAKIGRSNVSLGYDRVRFIAAVFEGDTITTKIRITAVDPQRFRVVCEETCTNQTGATVAASQHIMRFI